MQGKSNSFLQVTPFKPRSGLLGSSYIAFPLDTAQIVRTCSFEFECRTRGGTAEIFGISEYASPSSPPKKYRTQTIDGSWCDNDHSAPNCSAPIANADRNVYSGQYLFSPTTGAETNNQLAEYYLGTSGADCSAVPFNSSTVPPKNFAPNIGVLVSETQTHRTWSAEVACTPTGGFFREISGEITSDLTDEDTEEQAIARLLDGLEWSEWSEGSNCASGYEQRTSGFTFDYSEAEFMLTGRGLYPGSNNDFSIGIYRRLFGSSDDYVLAETIHYSAVANSNGVAVITHPVANVIGYESVAVVLETPCGVIENPAPSPDVDESGPPLSIDTGEGGRSQIQNGENFDAGLDFYSFPDFFFEIRNEDNDSSIPPFVASGDLSISNLTVSCPDHPSYFGTITDAGPAGPGNICTFQVESGGGSPSSGAVITIGFDWVCGTDSGSYEITITI